MDFELTAEQRMIAETAHQFAREKLDPIANRLDEPESKKQFLKNLEDLAQLGFIGLNVNSEYGGSEAGTVAFSIAITEIARVCASTAVSMSVTSMVGEVIQSVASELQKKRYLPSLCSGEIPAASFCLTEANAGSDPAGMRCTARREGDEWVINGTKIYITSAEYAGLFVLWAVTDSDAPKGKGISCFLVERDFPGLIVGPPEKKMGQHGSSTNEVIFDDCRLPLDALMGELNQGFKIAVTELAGGRIGIGSLALGVGTAAMDYAVDYAKQRNQFDQPISEFQGLRWMIVDRYTELEAARLLLMNAASQKENGSPYMKSASMAKLYATEKAIEACNTAMQLMGGAGYLRDHPIERFMRDVRVTSIYEGTSQIQKEIIGREVV